MANTFLAAAGHDLGASPVRSQEIEVARRLMAVARRCGVDITLPQDLVVTDSLAGGSSQPRWIDTTPVDAVPSQALAVDLGPKTLQLFADTVSRAKVLFWNGPVGVFETPPFDQGCRQLARCVANSPAYTVVGGGETVAAIHQTGVASRIDQVSTGGGASLALVAGKKLPGLEVLEGAS